MSLALIEIDALRRDHEAIIVALEHRNKDAACSVRQRRSVDGAAFEHPAVRLYPENNHCRLIS